MGEKEIEKELSEYRRMVREIETVSQEVSELWAQAVSAAANVTDERVQSSGAHDRLGESVAKYADKLNEFYDDEFKAAKELRALKDKIRKVEDNDAATVLMLLYIKGETPAEVERTLSISRATFYRWKERGLELISETS